ncbi:MAG: bifunctional folylpolyglutamate synthase/dihydrofolate synthase [Acidobacteriota bacterium]
MSGAPPLAGSAERLLAPRLEQRILPGLERMARALEALGHPERAFPALLVLGTNGKGSTAALLDAVVRAHGTSVGLYTSPHLIRVEERIRVNGAAISPGRLLELVRELERFRELSYFETLTVAAFLEFAARGVSLAVLEAGLGGRWDATNATRPLAALLTNVGTDHQGWLGPTRGHIAAEKAAALRGHEAIVGAWDDEVEPVIRREADPQTPISLASQWAEVTIDGRSPAPGAFAQTRSGVQAVTFRLGGTAGATTLPLVGRHQIDNLRLALAGAAALASHGVIGPLAAEAVARGVAAVSWPGRLQRLAWQGGELLLDGAHNREAAVALAAALDELGLSGRVDLLFSCLQDKPLAEMAALLRPRARTVHVAPLDSPRATPADLIAGAFPGCVVHADVTAALAALATERTTLVTGSLRLIGAVLAHTGRADA